MSQNEASGAVAGVLRAAAIILAALLIYLLICSSTGIFYNRFMSSAK